MIIENQRLAELLKTKSTFDHKTVAASVIYSDSTGAERVITIDKGSDDGVVPERHRPVPGGALCGQVHGGRPQLRHGAAAQRHPLRWSSAGTSARAPRARSRATCRRPWTWSTCPPPRTSPSGDTVVTAGGFGKELRVAVPQGHRHRHASSRSTRTRRASSPRPSSSPPPTSTRWSRCWSSPTSCRRPLPGATPAPNLRAVAGPERDARDRPRSRRRHPSASGSAIATHAHHPRIGTSTRVLPASRAGSH